MGFARIRSFCARGRDSHESAALCVELYSIRSHNWEYTGGLDWYGSLLCQADHRPRLWDAGVVGLLSTSYVVLEGQPYKHQLRLGQQEYLDYVGEMLPKHDKNSTGLSGCEWETWLIYPQAFEVLTATCDC